VTALRRELGRQLAGRRKAAGYAQRELGVMMGYSRTAIANAETGGAALGRQLWQAADRVLGTGELFALGYDRIRAQKAAETQARPQQLATAHRQAQRGAGPAPVMTISQAQRACQDRGWPAEQSPGGRLWLITGTAIDALEVPHQAGMVAMHWWLYTRGLPDQIRGLPALPDPHTALAVISVGPVCYFLARSGACPWNRRDTTPAGAASPAGHGVVRWHAAAGRVPAPPSPLDDGQQASWAHIPSGDGPLVSPMALLHLLAQSIATTRHNAGLMLPGGVHAVPAASRACGEPRC
jgi:transcriptional regulator with XRE-family HTH domain